MRRIGIFLLSLCFAYPVLGQKVGLVLSGGGAKGAVHIGIIKALEDNDIPIDYIAGTSIGAIVGSLYAIGYSPEEMLELFLSDDFYYWQTGKVEDIYQNYFRKAADQPDFMRIMVPIRDSGDIKKSLLPMNLVNPIQMNQAFLQLYSQANAQCDEDFDNLFVPFLCVASDIYNKRAKIFRSGPLEDAVRASMTFPLVFKPIYRDSVPLFDGGIYNNFPVKPMKAAFHPDFIIGSSVAGSSKKKRPEQMDMYDMVENMVMQQTVYDVAPEDGIMMHTYIDDVSLLDFDKSRRLYELGYKQTLELIDSIKSRVNREVPKEEVVERRIFYKENLPPLRFRNIFITGINAAQKQYIESQIHREKDNFFSIKEYKRTYFMLLANSKIKEIFPSAVYDPEHNVFDLYLDIIIKDEIGIAFGGNVSSMSANQLYLGLTYQSLAEVASSLSLNLQVGNTYTGAALNTRIELPTPRPIDITASLVHNYHKYFESEKLFIDSEVSTFIHQRETYGKIGIGFPITHRSKIDLNVGYGRMDDKYYKQQGTLWGSIFDQSIYKLFYSGFMYRLSTTDAKQYPLKGRKHHVYVQYMNGVEQFVAAGVRGTAQEIPMKWIQADGYLQNMHSVSNHFNFGYVLQGVFSTKNLLSNYAASVLQAPAYSPTPHSMLVFNEAFRAYQFAAAGVIPIYKLNQTFHLQGDFHGFMPIWPVLRGENDVAVKGELFSKPAWLGEISLVARLPFLNISLFANHYSHPKNNWNVGLNIGYLIFGQKFIP